MVLRCVFGVWHHAEDGFALAQDARNVAERPIRVGGIVHGNVLIAVTEGNAVLIFQLLDGRIISEEVPFAVRDGHM